MTYSQHAVLEESIASLALDGSYDRRSGLMASERACEIDSDDVRPTLHATSTLLRCRALGAFTQSPR